jgi:hypothetical protein
VGTWTLTADFDALDGSASPTKHVTIYANTQITTSAGVIFETVVVPVVDGELSVTLPSPGTGTSPDDFGFLVYRTTGPTSRWQVPAQTAGSTHSLEEFTPTTALPVPAGFDAQLAALNNLIGAVGVNADDVGYDLVIVAGQSNASGYGEGYSSLLDPTHGRIWQFANSGSLTDQVCLAIDPLFHHAQAPPGRIGFTMTLARMFADRTPENRRILIVPVAHGGSAMRPQGSGVWDPDYVPGAFVSLYANAVQQITQAQALRINDAPPNNRIVGFFWHQGETDSFNDTFAGQYQAKLDRMIDQFRIDIPELAGVPMALGQMVPETIPTTTSEPIVNAVHIDTPRRKVLTGFAYGPFGYSQIKVGEDSVHYSGAGQRVFAPILFAAWQRAQLNVLGTDALVPTGVVLTQSTETTAVLTWLQAECRVTDYNVQYKIGAGDWAPLTRAQSIDVTATITGLAVGESAQARVATVNEEGASGWDTSEVVLMLAVPAQVTGLAAGTPTSQTVPLTWSAATGAARYAVEYKKHADSTWVTFGTVTTLAATVTGLASSTSYDFRVTGRNDAGAGVPSSTVNPTTAAPLTLVEDMAVGTDPRVAYSVARRLVPGALKAFKVRRSSDNATQDIGFATGTNDVDAAALATFIGANSGTIDTVYDQGPNGWNFTQATTTKQIRIVNAGVLDTQNSKPAAVADGVDDQYLDATALHLSLVAGGGVATQCAVLRPQSKATASHMVYGEVGAAAANTTPHMSLIGESGTTVIKPLAQCRADDATFPINTSSVNVDTSDALHARWTVADGTTVRQDIDGTVSTAAANALAIPDSVITVTQRHLLGFGTSLLFKGWFTELVTWGAVLTEAQIAAGKTNQKSYYGTP